MKKLHLNLYWELLFFQKEERIEVVWSESTAEMKDHEFRELLLFYLEEVIRLRPKKVLVDTRKFLFIVGLDTQNWVDTEINQYVIQNGVEALAFLMSADLFAQVSIEQTLDEQHALRLQPHFFDDRQKAVLWLNEACKVLK